jgi:hypothetical protein
MISCPAVSLYSSAKPQKQSLKAQVASRRSSMVINVCKSKVVEKGSGNNEANGLFLFPIFEGRDTHE